ncbi:MAG: hypothetical protein EHM83_06235 [Burkholderiales bacterium]|nr:MAG: hypothetical protein EHM83_06235 [Burkholderiales bacterium]
MNSRLTAADAAALLREILAEARELRLRDARRPWVRIAVGECAVLAGDAQVAFFADSASLDHVAAMRLADGREGAFADWLSHDGVNPLDLLDEAERTELEHRLHAAT